MAALRLPLSHGALRLDELREGDYPAYLALYADARVASPAGLPELSGGPEIRRWFDNSLALPAAQGRIFALRPTGVDELAGVLRLTDYEAQARHITLGYALSPTHWGKGWMSTCLAAVLPWLLQGGLSLPLHRIQAWTRTDNHRSRRLLARQGFHHEGTLRGVYWQDLHHHDLCIYGLLAGDLAPRRPATSKELAYGLIRTSHTTPCGAGY